jgi:aspartyl-tRNA(Asn)/glutamyl-tRNA(Gln) amidotransferase subunit A
MKLWDKTLLELHKLLSSREVSSIELLDSVLQRIHEKEPSINAYLCLMEQAARKQAETADRRFQKKENLTYLTGIPIAVKDNICVQDYPTTCASKMLKNFIPPYNATVVEKLLDSGAVLLGKTNMDEFAMGSSCENSAFGPTRNPWDTSCVPGGSSGGSAASVAAGEAVGALGSDTGGSLRQPAAFCGVVGLKPTYGIVSRYGLIAFASSLDQVGPLARSSFDCSKILQCIGGYDPKDATSVQLEISELENNDYFQKDNSQKYLEEIKNRIIGIPEEFLNEGTDSDVKQAVTQAADCLESLGAKVVMVNLSSLKYALSTYYLIASAEASSNLARYDGVRYGLRISKEKSGEMFKTTRSDGFGKEVQRRIMLGTYALSSGYYDALYLKAQKLRHLIKQDFDKAFQKCSLFLTPTSPTAAFKIGEKISDPLTMYLSDIYTIPANLAGIPALSVPVGFSSKNLPISVQLLAPRFQDFLLLMVGSFLEKLSLEIP